MTMPREFYIPNGAEQVADPNSDAVAYTYERAGVLYGMVFVGKQSKPLWHYRYRNEAERAGRIEAAFAARRATLAYRAESRAKRKAELAKPHGLNVGSVLVSSWGYEQTNIDYFQVTALVGSRMVEVRPILSDSEETGWCRGKSVPAADQFAGPAKRRRVMPGGTVRIDSVRRARPWDGQPNNWTSYA